MTDDQIKHIVSRFLQWKLPEDFRPDGGISFDPWMNEHTPWPSKREPVGTNLFDATQAEAMVRFILEGMHPPMTTNTDTQAHGGGVEAVARIIAKWVDDERFADAPAFRMAAREIIAALAASPAAPAPAAGVKPSSFIWTDELYAAFEAIDVPVRKIRMAELLLLWRGLTSAAQFPDPDAKGER